MEEKTTLVDLTTGEIRTKKKKVPKEKTPAENILKDAKTHYNKLKKLNDDLPKCVNDLHTHAVQNSSELVAALERHIAQLEHHLVCAETMSNTPLSDVDVEHMRTEMDTEKFWVTNLN